jgi:nitroimidazol reductase NimA-like FMN-containing flavoprotein (pyridoxamine 5'-phosphate oxidase superfamily)
MTPGEPVPEPVAPDAQDILARGRLARVSTVSPSGAPALAAFWFHFDGERLVLFTGENATVRNLRRDPRISVVVDLGERFDEIEGVLLRGRAEVHAYDQAPSPVLSAVAELEQKYADEIASPLYREFQGDGPPATVYVDLVPTSSRWWSFGRRVT